LLRTRNFLKPVIHPPSAALCEAAGRCRRRVEIKM
jgi:hypothetical protein